MNPPPDAGRAVPPPAAGMLPRSRHASRLAALFDLLRLGVGYTVYGALALGVIAACWLIAIPVRAEERRKAWCQFAVHLGVKLWLASVVGLGIFEVDFPEADRLRAVRGTIIAPSHPMLIDALLFLARLPRLTCLMKKSILKNPFMGRSTRLAGYLPNDHGREFIRRGRDALRAGENLLIFPEGTRTVTQPINPFKLGFALMAKLADAPVQTVFITAPYFLTGKRWKLWWVPVLPLRISVRLGEAFRARPEQSAHDFGVEVERYFREAMSR